MCKYIHFPFFAHRFNLPHILHCCPHLYFGFWKLLAGNFQQQCGIHASAHHSIF